MAVELKRTAAVLRIAGKSVLAQTLEKRGQAIEDGIWEYGVVNHKKYGGVFAFEVDGYGSHIMMDDANVPSLLALPILGFVDVDNLIYKNTRKMILEQAGNPYYLHGKGFKGIGGMFQSLSCLWIRLTYICQVPILGMSMLGL
jgi:meiotically up-regulated gene 157 (Mug157) protein